MKLTINGQSERIDKDTLTVVGLLAYKEVSMPDMVSVEHNGIILDRDTFATTQVKDGDDIEFLYLMGGGSSDAF